MMITSTSRLSVRVGEQVACNGFSDMDPHQGVGSIAMQISCILWKSYEIEVKHDPLL